MADSSGILYGASGAALFPIDLATGNLDTQTVLTYQGTPIPMNSIAYDSSNGILYGASGAGLFPIDLATGNLDTQTVLTYQGTLIPMNSIAYDPVPTPEPSTFVLLVAGAIGLAAYVWRRKRAARRSTQPDAQEEGPAIVAFPSQLSYRVEATRRAA